MMMHDGYALAFPLIPWFFAAIPFAIGNGVLARRLGRSVPLWVILTLLPIVNVFFSIYVGYTVILAILDDLRAIAGRDGARA